MSLFKSKLWWTNEALLGDKYDEGTQNSYSIKVEKFNSHSDSDCIIVGQVNVVKIYKPNIEENTSHTILESQLDDIILQIGTGKFTMNADDCQILILHPNSFAIYSLRRSKGHIDLGDQNYIELVTKHSFNRKACSMICGPFGSSKSRDFICIQALDGTLSFFDQDTFMFMCVYNDIIIPGPLCYVPSSDLFVICKSTWILETYSFQQLSEFSELSVRTNKKNIPQWTYNAGEEIMSTQVIRTSTNFSSIIIMGEKHIFCFQDNGLMKYMIRFDFMPICFHAYLFGWYYEPNSRLLVMVASDDSNLFIYEGSTLLWSCDLPHKTISLSRCFVKNLSGGLVSLSSTGIVTISYLGTEPDLNSSASTLHETTDPQKIQTELEEVENSLRRISEDATGEVEYDSRKFYLVIKALLKTVSVSDPDEHYSNISRILKIKADIGKPINNLGQDYVLENEQHLSCSVVVMLTCEDPSLIQSIQITYKCYLPIYCSESTVCLENINGTEIIETQVFVMGDADVHNAGINIVFTIIDSRGKISVLSQDILLPLSLYCLPVDVVSHNSVSITINTNYPCVGFEEIFSDFTKEELSKYINKNMLTFLIKTSNKTVSIKSFDNCYCFEADDFNEMYPILHHVLNNIKNHFQRQGILEFQTNFEFGPDLGKQLVHKFLKGIEGHAKERIKLRTLEVELNVLHKQFTLVQKRLLVQYGSLPPGDCDPLGFLMKDTHERVISVARKIMQDKQSVQRASNAMSAVGNLLVCILQEASPGNFNVKLIQEMLSLESLSEQFQEWEEAILQGSSYIIKNVMKKSEKDKEKLTPVTDQDILSHSNLKRFLKQIRIILDRVFSDIEENSSGNKKEPIIRIEELVEVI